jgi:transmembrane sensor
VSEQEDPRRAWATDEQWLRLRERITAADVAVPRQWYDLGRHPWLIAAGIGLAAGALITAGLATRHTRAEAPFAVTTSPGQRTSVRLTDNSTVRLGPASSLSYVSTEGGRELRLVGIAAFTVVHDPARPFVVHAGNATTADIGTEFSVRAYATDTAVEVAVMSGAVRLASTSTSGATTNSTIVLRAGDVGRVAAGTVMRVARSDTAASLAWVDGRVAGSMSISAWPQQPSPTAG